MPWTLSFWNSNPTPPNPSVTWNWTGTGTIAPSDVPTQQVTDITNYLNSIASISTYAQSRLNAYGQDIRIGYQFGNAGQAFKGPFDDYILTDLVAARQVYFFNTEGRLVAADVRLTLMHELAHIYLSAIDPNNSILPTEAQMNAADYDFRGPVVDEQNLIALDARLTDQIQTSYFAALSSSIDAALFAQFSTGVSYSNGNAIDTTRWGTSGTDNINHSLNTIQINDLLFGLAGDDHIWSGIGDDYVYGGDDDDTIYSGGDDDEYWGGMRDETGRTDGIDTVIYANAMASVTLTLSGTTTAALTVQDGDGGTDALHSIERIQGSNNGDTLIVQSLTSETGSAFDWIDLSGGNDTVDVSALSGAVTVDLRIAGSQTVTFGGVVLNLRNVENATTAGGDDVVYLPASGGASTITAGTGNDMIYLAGSGHTITAGDGYDTLNLSTVVTGSRIDIAGGSALVRASGSSSFSSVEEVVGGGGSNLMYGDGTGTTLVGGTGVNYIEGSGADILRSASGDTYFSASDGATVISGAGNDYIEVSGSQPVTIQFGVGSGNDMLGSYFNLQEDWAFDRQFDLILLQGLSLGDIELIWDFEETAYYDDENQITRVGEAAIRIISTGETLYLGTIKWHTDDDPYFGELWLMTLEDTQVTDGNIDSLEEVDVSSYDYRHVGSPYNTSGASNNDTDPYINTIDASIFSFDGVTRYSLFEIFDLTSIVSTALPPEVKVAEDLLDRLATATDGGLAAGTANSDVLSGTSGSDDMLGGAGNDTLNASSGDDLIRGGSGNDTIIAGVGNDNIDGGSGRDIFDGSASVAAMSIDVAQGTVSGVDVGTDRVRSIETYLGGSGADTFLGDSGANKFFGGAGDDLLSGGANSDFLVGGLGADTFRDTTVGLDGDTIADFSFGDRIIISDANIATFDVALDGMTLNFTGGSLTLGSAPNGRIVAREASGGGVELRLVPRIALNDGRTDFNGDGRDDILWRSEGNELSDWLGIASGGYVINDVNAYTMVPGSWHIAGTGDFNGDGRDDILWRSETGILSNWLGLANGGFTINDANALIGVPNDWQVVATGDFNGDGRDDILWRGGTGTITNWLGTPSGGLTNNDSNAMAGVPVEWQVVGVGDFDGDGRDDILWRNDSGILSNWLGSPSGGFVNNDANALTSVSNGMQVVGTGDFNGDGRDDILWRDDLGAIFNWLGTASGGFANNSANSTYDISLDWTVAGTGDFNGDGRDDILWRNDSGALINWLGTPAGGFTPNAANSFSDVPTNWHVQSPDLIVV